MKIAFNKTCSSFANSCIVCEFHSKAFKSGLLDDDVKLTLCMELCWTWKEPMRNRSCTWYICIHITICRPTGWFWFLEHMNNDEVQHRNVKTLKPWTILNLKGAYEKLIDRAHAVYWHQSDPRQILISGTYRMIMRFNMEMKTPSGNWKITVECVASFLNARRSNKFL